MSDKRTPKVASDAAVQHQDGCTATMAYVGDKYLSAAEQSQASVPMM
jgi:hypothetical protein